MTPHPAYPANAYAKRCLFWKYPVKYPIQGAIRIMAIVGDTSSTPAMKRAAEFSGKSPVIAGRAGASKTACIIGKTGAMRRTETPQPDG
jgi:hypothetical protein